MVSDFQGWLSQTEDYHRQMYEYEGFFMSSAQHLLKLLNEGKGNPKQRKLAKELLEEAGLI